MLRLIRILFVAAEALGNLVPLYVHTNIDEKIGRSHKTRMVDVCLPQLAGSSDKQLLALLVRLLSGLSLELTGLVLMLSCNPCMNNQ